MTDQPTTRTVQVLPEVARALERARARRDEAEEPIEAPRPEPAHIAKTTAATRDRKGHVGMWRLTCPECSKRLVLHGVPADHPPVVAQRCPGCGALLAVVLGDVIP